LRLRTERFKTVSSTQESKTSLRQAAGDRHLVERHGDRRSVLHHPALPTAEHRLLGVSGGRARGRLADGAARPRFTLMIPVHARGKTRPCRRMPIPGGNCGARRFHGPA
jgi:hypothetical protein